MDRDAAQDIINRHQPSRWWRLLGERRCRACGKEWRCEPHINAVDAIGLADAPRLEAWIAQAVRAETEGTTPPPPWRGLNGGRW